MSWIENLRDNQLKTILTVASSDLILSYNEMLDVFKVASLSGITEAEFDSLKQIFLEVDTGQSGLTFESEYLEYISTAVVHHHSANSIWTGGAVDLNKRVTASDMSAGMSEQQAQYLYQRWFLGGDLPQPLASDDAARGNGTFQSKYTYAEGRGPLIKDGIDGSDIYQGSIGSCYLIASAGLLASVNPALIKDAFTSNPNGTFGVRFFLNGEAVYTTVNKMVPVTAGTNRIAMSHSGDTDVATAELWLTLLEKAYAQLTAFEKNPRSGEINTYGAIVGGWVEGLEAITGEDFKKPALTYLESIESETNGAGNGWLAMFYYPDGVYSSEFYQLIVGDISTRVNNHAFYTLGIDADSLIVVNPWNPLFKFNDNLIGDWKFYFSPIPEILYPSEREDVDPSEYYLSADSLVVEGESVVATVSRSNTTSEETVFLSAAPVTASALDFRVIEAMAITFKEGQSTRQVKVNVFEDGIKELQEHLEVFLTRSAGVVNPSNPRIASSKVLIGDKTTQSSYSIESKNLLEEGGNYSIKISRDNIEYEETIFLSTVHVTTTDGDIDRISSQRLVFKPGQSNVSVEIKTNADDLVEGQEEFEVVLHYGQALTISDYHNAAVKLELRLEDTTTVEQDFDLKRVGNGALKEGEQVEFTISRESSLIDTFGTVSVLTKLKEEFGVGYVSSIDGIALDSERNTIDFKPGEIKKTLTITLLDEGRKELLKSASVQLLNSNYSRIYDSEVFTYTDDKTKNTQIHYQITTSDEVDEGKAVDLVISRDKTDSQSTVYLTIDNISTSPNDLSNQKSLPITFNPGQRSISYSVNTFLDSLIEGSEYFSIGIGLAPNGDPLESKTIKINDVNVAPIEYTFISNSIPSEVVEGESIKIGLSRSTNVGESQLIVKVSGGTADDKDADLGDVSVQFEDGEFTSYFNLQTFSDTVREGQESILVSISEELSADSKTIKLNDSDSMSYFVINAVNSTIAEGRTAEISVTRSYADTSETIYIRTASGTAQSFNNRDFASLESSIVFSEGEYSKTFEVQTELNSEEEDTEYFDILLSLTPSGDTLASERIFITDNGPQGIIDYNVEGNSFSTAFIESNSQPSEIKIKRNDVSEPSHIYVALVDGSASSINIDGGDISLVSPTLVSFDAGQSEATVEVMINDDRKIEGTETFYVNVYDSYEKYISGKESSTGLIYAKDKEYTHFYQIEADLYLGFRGMAYEGETIKLTVSRPVEPSWYFDVGYSYGYVTVDNRGKNLDVSRYSDENPDIDFPQGIVFFEFNPGESEKEIYVPVLKDDTPEAEYVKFSVWRSLDEIILNEFTDFVLVDLLDIGSNAYELSVDYARGGTFTLTESSEDWFEYAVERLNTSEEEVLFVVRDPRYINAATDEDFEINGSKLVFLKGDKSATFKIRALADDLDEGEESLFLKIIDEEGNTSAHLSYAFSMIDILDPKPETQYGIKWSLDRGFNGQVDYVSEGDSRTILVGREGVLNEATVYLNIFPGYWRSGTGSDYPFASNSDMNFVVNQEFIFAAGESEKTFSVTALSDSLIESTEHLRLLVTATPLRDDISNILINQTEYSDEKLSETFEYLNSIDLNLKNDYRSIAVIGIKDVLSEGAYQLDWYFTELPNYLGAVFGRGESISITVQRKGYGTESAAYIQVTERDGNTLRGAQVDLIEIIFSPTETEKVIEIEPGKYNITNFSFFLLAEADGINDSSGLQSINAYRPLGLPLVSQVETAHHSSESYLIDSQKLSMYSHESVKANYLNSILYKTLDGSSIVSGRSVLHDDLDEGVDADLYHTFNQQIIYVDSNGLIKLSEDQELISQALNDYVSAKGEVKSIRGTSQHTLIDFTENDEFILLSSGGGFISSEELKQITQDDSAISHADIWGSYLKLETGKGQIILLENLNLEGGTPPNVVYQGDKDEIEIITYSDDFITLVKSNETYFFTVNEKYSFIAEELKNIDERVIQIVANSEAVSFVDASGKVNSFGRDDAIGGIEQVSNYLEATGKIIDSLYSTENNFFITTESGEVLIWGNDSYIADNVIYDGSAIDGVVATDNSITVLFNSGNAYFISDTVEKLDFNSLDVDRIYANSDSYLARLTNGTYYSWGALEGGGDSASLINSYLANGKDVLEIKTVAEMFLVRFQDSEYLALGRSGLDLVYAEDIYDVSNGSVNDVYTAKSLTGSVDLGYGLDKLVFQGSRTEYVVSVTNDVINVEGATGSLELNNIERLDFDDVSIAYDLDQNAGEAAKLIGAYLGDGALANYELVGLVLSYFDSGLSTRQLLSMANDTIFSDSSGREVVSHFYRNLTGSEAPGEIVDYYGSQVDLGYLSLIDLGELVMNSEPNLIGIDIVGLRSSGLVYEVV